jgi:PAS domain S-box-containing protein
LGAIWDRLDDGFFRSAVENSQVCLRILDLDGRVQFVNPAGRAILEIEDSTFVPGRLWAALWPNTGRAEVERGFAAVRRGESYDFEGECATARGAMKWWHVAISPIRDADGAVAAILAASRDITTLMHGRRAMELQALRLARTATAANLAARVARLGGWEIDFLTEQTFFSAELCELLGSPPLPEMATAEALNFWCEEDRPAFDRCTEAARRGVRMVFEGQARDPHGALRWWRVLGEPELVDGRCVAVRGVAQDITEWRAAMDRLHTTEQSRQAAVLAADAMSRFLATMSHEIRTPLNGVLGMAHAMGRDPLSPPQRERLEVIESSGEALLALLNDLLDFAKIESGQIELEVGVMDVQGLAEGVEKTFGALLKDKHLKFTLTVAPEARGFWIGDAKRVRQVLHNLISNAVKFTDHGGVSLAMTYEDGRLILRISDTGIGIAPNRLAQVFERFIQADASTTRRYGGSGLGLTICRDLLTLMDGDIDVESNEGLGSTFIVSLPLTRAEAPRAAPRETAEAFAETGSPQALRVLAAEDNAINRLVLKTLLGEVGIEPTIVANGQEAIDAWREGGWDLVLMDVQMPVMDGPAAVRVMRETERREGRVPTPVIALTANAMTHHEAEYRAAGMDALVAKPINLAALLKTMEAVMAPPQAQPRRAKG